MHVLMVNHEFPPLGGGGGNANYYLGRELVRRGHQVTVVTSGAAELPAEETVAGMRVVRLQAGRRRPDVASIWEMVRFLLRAGAWVWRQGRQGGWDVVQTFFVVPSGPVGVCAGWRARAPVVVRLGGGDLPGHEPRRFRLTNRLLRPAVRWMLGAAAARVANSAGLRERAGGAYPGLAFQVVENGVDLEEFRPSPTPRDGPPVVLVSARLIERKGLEYLVEALGTLHREGLGFRLRVAGDGPRREALEAQARAEGLEGRVEWLGRRRHEELAAIYREADLFVLPSLSEGMSNAVLEALATGLPLIVTAVPGSAELVREGQNGLIVPPRDATALEGALRRLLTDGELRARLGRASRRWAERYSWRQRAEEYLALYEAVRIPGVAITDKVQ